MYITESRRMIEISKIETKIVIMFRQQTLKMCSCMQICRLMRIFILAVSKTKINIIEQQGSTSTPFVMLSLESLKMDCLIRESCYKGVIYK